MSARIASRVTPASLGVQGPGEIISPSGFTLHYGVIETNVVQKAIKDLGINPEKSNPAVS